VHHTESLGFWTLCPSSGILNTRKHNVKGTGSVSVLRRGEGDTYFVGSLRKSSRFSLPNVVFFMGMKPGLRNQKNID
jgi:hypothetical protein